jgi:hypothetical protein
VLPPGSVFGNAGASGEGTAPRNCGDGKKKERQEAGAEFVWPDAFTQHTTNAPAKKHAFLISRDLIERPQLRVLTKLFW